jgi:hypothetical protein
MYTVIVATDTHVNIAVDVRSQRTLKVQARYTVGDNTLMPYNNVHVVSVFVFLSFVTIAPDDGSGELKHVARCRAFVLYLTVWFVLWLIVVNRAGKPR